MKDIKRVLSITLIFVITLSEGVNVVQSIKSNSKISLTASSSTSWNFSDTTFRNLGTITRAYTINNLRLHAQSDKSMQIKQESASVNGQSFSYGLVLGGSGAPNYRSVSFENSGTSTVKITARSSGTTSRTIILTDIYKKQLGSISFGTSASLNSAVINFTGTVFIYSSDSSITLYKIQVDSNSSSSS